MLILFLKGFLIGLVIAAPIGPIGVLCVQRTLDAGFKIGLMTGLGAALADGLYGVMGLFGVTAVSSIIVQAEYWLQVLGGILLMFLGFALLLKNPVTRADNSQERSSFHAFFSTFLLTLTNPATLLLFIAVFTGLGLAPSEVHWVNAVAIILGIVLGSVCWWLSLSAGVAFVLHHRLSFAVISTINRLAGFIFVVTGVVFLLWELWQ